MKYIEFEDKGFEKALRSALKIKTKKITEKTVSQVIGICINDHPTSGLGIPWSADSTAFNMIFPDFFFDINESENGQWIQDLEHFSHIKSLYLYVPIQDLSFLKSFHSLKELYVTGSENKDWSFIENLISLSHLFVSHSSFTDLTPLSQLSKQQLQLYAERSEEVTVTLRLPSDKPLYLFDGLRYLYLEKCGISDITPLLDCGNLNELNLSHNQISHISPLKELQSLYYLTLRYNQIENIEPLKDLTGIYLINLRHNQVSNIKVLENHINSNLSRLFLADNPISDFTPIRKIRLVDHDIPILNEWR